MKTTENFIEYLYPGSKDVEKINPTDSVIVQLRKEICKITNLPYQLFFEKTKKGGHVITRQMMAVVLKIFTKYSLAEIGYEAGRIDHATVLWAIRKVAELHATDIQYRQTFTRVISKAETIFKKDRNKRPATVNSTGLISRGLWRYAVELLHEEVRHLKLLKNNPTRDEITSLEEIIRDKDRELRLIRGQLERSRIKNSYEYVD